MSVRSKGALITWTTGVPDGAPVMLLHDRYLDHDASDTLAAALEPTHRVVSVRSARTQMEDGFIKGYYWYLGPYDVPELSTLGDALHHLERLLVRVNAESGRRVALVGTGEGGSMALAMGLLWREIVAGIVSIDGPLFRTLDEIPMTLPATDGLPVLLAGRTRDMSASATALAARGASVGGGADEAGAIARWVAGLDYSAGTILNTPPSSATA